MNTDEKITQSANEHVQAYLDLFWGELFEFINKEDDLLEFDDRLLVASRIAGGLHNTVTRLIEKRLGVAAIHLKICLENEEEYYFETD